jgi:lysophospholipase L1-like esterase
LKIIFSAILLLVCFAFTPNEKKKVLIIGDSISIGYFPFVKSAFGEDTIVIHNEGKAQHTGTGLKKIKSYLNNERWDVIHFNWGLWDLCYRDPVSNNQGHRNKLTGKVELTTDQYEKNLDSLVSILNQTGAKLIFATTTVVPPNELGRIEGDDKKYNATAMKVIKKYNVRIDDLNLASYEINKNSRAGDGNVHFTREGYRQLSYAVIKSIRKALTD